MKNYLSKEFFDSVKQLLMKMKATLLILLLFASSLFATNVSSQVAKVNIALKDARVVEVLKSIEEQTNFLFVYNKEEIDLDRKVNINVSGQTIDEVLLNIFPNADVTYKKLGSSIILMKNIGLQNSTSSVSGKVTDSTGLPLPGVSIVIKGSTNGTITDFDGKYTMPNISDDVVLVFSFVGMKTQEIHVEGKTTIDVILREESIGIEEVIAVGYGTVKKSDITGSISSLKGNEMMKGSPLSLEQGMQGKLAGVNITKNDGSPGGGITMQIRGTNSFIGSAEPLYVIDGIPMATSSSQETINFNTDKDVTSRNALSFLSPDDIESIEVLKDASSIAIYGSLGANGVVMITTKTGKVGKDKISLNYNLTCSTVNKRLDVLGAKDYAQYRNTSYINTNTINNGSYNPDQLPFPGKENSEGEYQKGPNDFDNDPYYWQDQIFGTGITQNFSLNFSGGTDNFDYAVGGSYVDQQGVVINSDYTRSNIKVNMNKRVRKWLKFGTSINVSHAISNMLKTSTKNKNNGDEGVIRSALYYPATYSVEDNVTLGEYSTVANPVQYTEALNENENYHVYSSNYLNLTLAKGLIYRMVLGYSSSINRANRYFPSYLSEGRSVGGRSQAGDNTWQNLTWDNLLMYNRTFGKHNINATAGTSWQTASYYNKRIETQGFGTDATNGWILQDGTDPQIPTSSKGDSELLSYILRAAYSYKGKYMMTGTFRRDASSKFAENNKAAYFPSIGIAWRLSEESFAKNIKGIDNLKLRYSYGTAGNAAISAYGSLALLTNANYPFGSSVYNGLAPDPYNPGNPSLKWETTYQHDVGLDIALFHKIDFAFDYYHKITSDLIQYKEQPPSSGIARILSNIGEVTNKGFELSANATIIENSNFKWTVGGVFSRNRNNVVSLGDADDERLYPNELWNGLRPFVIEAGKPIGQLIGYVEEGIWNSREEVIGSKQFQTVYPGYSASDSNTATELIIKQKWIGEIRYKDIDDSGDITESDMDYIGNVNPDFTYSLNMNFTIKDFDLYFLFEGVNGNDIINMTSLRFYNLGNTQNTLKSVLNNAWTEQQSGTNPKIYYDSARNFLFSQRFIENGSYLKLRNVSIGYTFRNLFKEISSVRLYASVNNLLTFTDYSGYDPEVNAFGSDPSQRGVDAGGYPQAKEFIFGVNLTF